MKLILAILFTVYLMARPEASLSAAREAMALWAQAVAPALFPFMALLPVFTGEETQGLYRRVAGRPMARLFRLPPEAAAAIAVGWIAGSPTGSLALARTATSGFTSRQTLTAAILASGCGPVFLICSVGAGMFCDPLTGVRLLVCAWMAQVLTALIVARLPDGKVEVSGMPASKGGEDVSPVRGAVLGVITVGGWMTLFGVIGSALPKMLRPFLEVSAGCAEAARGGNGMLAAFMCGFGGVCAGCQNLDALKDLGIKGTAFFACKLLVGLMSAGMYAGLRHMPWTQGTGMTDNLYFAALIALGLALISIIFTLVRGEKRSRDLRAND